jgi:hypothetical protein
MSDRGIRQFQMAASLRPHLNFMEEHRVIDTARKKQVQTPPRRLQTDQVKKSLRQLTYEIKHLQSDMDEDELQARPGRSREFEPVDIALLRHSIAAAIEEDSSAPCESNLSVETDHQQPVEEEEEEDAPEQIDEAERRRREMLRLSPVDPRRGRQTGLSDRSLRIDDITSGPASRSSFSRRRSAEYFRLMDATEKARTLLRSQIRGPHELPAPKLPRRSRAAAEHIDVRTVTGVNEHIRRLKKPPPKKQERLERAVLPDRPVLTNSFERLGNLLNREIDDILAPDSLFPVSASKSHMVFRVLAAFWYYSGAARGLSGALHTSS